MIESYPLYWPENWLPTREHDRIGGPFKNLTFGKVRDELMRQLDRMDANDIILSTNIPLRNDGLPYASFKIPTNPGVAVYFDWHTKPMCFACDKYKTVAANMRAISLTIEALRGIDRWGASDMLERAFTGFLALTCDQRNWWEILNIPKHSSIETVKTAYQNLVRIHHPDKGGDKDKFIEIRKGYEKAVELLEK